MRRAYVGIVLCFVGSAGAAEVPGGVAAEVSGGWATGPRADPATQAERMFATAGGADGKGALLVDCSASYVLIDVGGVLDDADPAEALARLIKRGFLNTPG